MFRKRQHPRMPVSIPVQVRSSTGMSCEVECVEIGAGGMSLMKAEQLGVSLPVEISFALGSEALISLHAVVWWKRNRLTGLRFDPSDRNCKLVREFVESQLRQ